MLDLEIVEINDAQAHSAKVIAGALSTPQIRKKGLIDILGINCAIGYLQSKNIKINTRRSIYKIPILFEEFQISDIYFENYRIDVITLYQDKMVKVPKFHAEINIMPHFYFIVQIGAKIKEAKMVGFIDAKSVLASKSDSKYFYPTLDKVFDIQKFITLTKRPLYAKSPIGKHIDCLGLFLKFIDNDLPSNYKKQFIRHIMTCDVCRSRFIDTLDFDRVASSIQNHPNLIKKYGEHSNILLEENYSFNTLNDFEKSIDKASIKEPAVEYEEEPSLNLEEIQQLDRHSLSKKFVDAIFNMKKIELSQFKTIVGTKSRRAILIMGLALFVISLFALIAIKDNIAIKKENEQIAQFNEQSQDYYNEEDEYYNKTPGEAKLIPKQRDISEFMINQPASNGPVYSPSVSKVSWEASESLVKDQNYTKFLQLIGKNIKLNLQNDLLLVNDVPVSKIVKVDIKLAPSHDEDYISISQSSGSSAIDESVKKVIDDTLKYMKPPSHGILSRSNEVTLTVELN